ncbi:SUMF1/EgtB/PvdO family nonheme iron enzyme [Candidatus Nomurabacteria bacterium]|nr:SUMF1/EgtB/PvdO family nonheme iron enzyme [Candidatus Nomurabacteria bacterium]
MGRKMMAAAVLMVGLLGACDPSVDENCSSNADCVGGYWCELNYCVPNRDAGPGVDGVLPGEDAQVMLPDGGDMPDEGFMPDAGRRDAMTPDGGEMIDAGMEDAGQIDATTDGGEMTDGGETDDMGMPSCEEDPTVGNECETGEQGVCTAGILECDGVDMVCAMVVEPSAEVCDGLDNDCDGEIDEDFDLQFDPLNCGRCGHQCELDGAVAACEAGLCVIAECEEGFIDLDGQPNSGCEYECTPTPGHEDGEMCGDQVDNNCNGNVDEGCLCDPREFESEPCQALEARGQCRRGSTVCRNGNGSRILCEPSEPSPEICNGIDDDCDGQVDEGLLNACGECGAVPQEMCNGRDDNCDGRIDEGYNQLGQACSVGVGACRASGVRQCSQDGREVVCTAVQGSPEDELCDGIDNDCDGDTDEELAQPDNLVCMCGNAEAPILMEAECTGEDGWICPECPDVCQPAAELCNDRDDDCDGDTDEDFDLSSDPTNCGGCNVRCPSPPNAVPVCAAAQCAFVCQQGFADLNGNPADGCESNCVPSGPEICDGVDNDCNGRVDEDLGGGPCDTGNTGVCAAGTLECQGEDGMVCVQNVEPSLEVCDGLDNDCDGQTDLEDPDYELPGQCDTGEQGQCAHGYAMCMDGVESCESMGPMDEMCDGVDNDCDGDTDEGIPGLGEACSVGVGACQREGLRVCGEQGAACDAEPGQPSEELCNGIDDDCNGEVDDGFINCSPEDYVLIRAGQFQMGSPANEVGRAQNEDRHEVTLTRDFMIGKYTVTQAEFTDLMGFDPSTRVGDCPDCPVETATWFAAIAYVTTLSVDHGLPVCYLNADAEAYNLVDAADQVEPNFMGLDCTGWRLPTDAEWEYAARANHPSATYGENFTDIGWFADNAPLEQPQSVGGKLPNGNGLYDMIGNVWEWTYDAYNGSLGNQAVVDPLFEELEANGRRTTRGGSAADFGRNPANGVLNYRFARRTGSTPNNPERWTGFRIVRTHPNN